MNARINYYFLVFLCISFMSCLTKINSKKENSISEYIKNIYIQRAEKDVEILKNKVIEPEKVKEFKGLRYFEIDTAFRVNAKISWLEKEKVIFKTNSTRSPEYFKFCELTFRLGDSICSLIVFTQDLDAQTGLFIPFKDKTNLQITYGGGRYIEVPYRGEKEDFDLDFNMAFNPYCHYNHTYSCPLVPYENTLNIAILAGEKKLYE